MKDLSTLEQNIHITLENKDLLRQAFVHRSYLNEHPDFDLFHNERLEFLGDAVLELVVTDYLYRNHQNSEGELTSWRAALVNSKMLARIGDALEFEEYLMVSRGTLKDNQRGQQFIVADAVEALIGAIYLDQGFDVAKNFIDEFVLTHFQEVIEKKLYKDPKTTLQELTQEKKNITPHYKVLEEHGPDHHKTFRVGVYIEEKLVAAGEGRSKQDAEEAAAHSALTTLDWDENNTNQE